VQVFHQNEILEPLSTKYIGDDDLLFKSRKKTTQDGFYFYDEEYLKYIKDHSINNYTNFSLTEKIKNDNIFDLRSIKYDTPRIFSSTLKFNNNKFLYFNNTNFLPEFTDKENLYSTFEISLLTENLCKIYFIDGFDLYFLNYEADKFFFTKKFNFLNGTFNYIKNKNIFYFLKKVSNSLKSITTLNDILSCMDIDYKLSPVGMNFYLQNFNFSGNSSWASYQKLNKNNLLIDPDRSILDCENNLLIYNNYTYISGSELEANFLVLKNQHTNKNYSYRADNLQNCDPNIPNVNIREYNSINTGISQELGFESMVLTYDLYNIDYTFKADNFTLFETPDSIYPFDRMNVNDSQLFKNGSIAGMTPYHADKLFQRDIEGNSETTGKYLCTWLSGNDKHAHWVDRYYYPEKTSLASSLSTEETITFEDKIENYLNTTLAPSAYYENFIWQDSLDDEKNSTPQKIKDAIWGEYFFDKASDVIFTPNNQYAYYRLGEKYAEKIIDALSGSLITDSLTSHRRYDGFEFIFDQPANKLTYNFTGNEYSLLENYRKINFTNEFTLAFSMNSYDWQAGFGHEIMGSFNDRGFGIFNDEKITPFIMIQEGRMVTILNTSFDEIDAVYLSQDELDMQVIYNEQNIENIATTKTYHITTFVVNDIIRTDHLNFFSPTIKNYDAFLEYKNDAVINRKECGILYTDESNNASRILSPNNLFDIDSQQIIEKIQIEQCQFKSKFKARKQL
jgi:hypothetical protein